MPDRLGPLVRHGVGGREENPRKLIGSIGFNRRSFINVTYGIDDDSTLGFEPMSYNRNKSSI